MNKIRAFNRQKQSFEKSIKEINKIKLNSNARDFRFLKTINKLIKKCTKNNKLLNKDLITLITYSQEFFDERRQYEDYLHSLYMSEMHKNVDFLEIKIKKEMEKNNG